MAKSPDAFRTISEVADLLDVPAHVLRFWEGRFTQIRPVKRAGGRRYYRPADILLLDGIRRLLHDDGMTIRGVQKLLREEGVRRVAAYGRIELAGEPDEDDPLLAEAPEAPVALDVEPEPDENRILPFRLRSGAIPTRPPARPPEVPQAGDAFTQDAPGFAEPAPAPLAGPAGFTRGPAPAAPAAPGAGAAPSRMISGDTALSEATPMAGSVPQIDPAGMSAEERNLRRAAAAFDDPAPREEFWPAPVTGVAADSAAPRPLMADPAGNPPADAAADAPAGDPGLTPADNERLSDAWTATPAAEVPDTDLSGATQAGAIPADDPSSHRSQADAAELPELLPETSADVSDAALSGEFSRSAISAGNRGAALLSAIPQDPDDADPLFAVPPLPLGRLTRGSTAGFERLQPLYLRLLGLRQGLNDSLRRTARP